MATTNVSDAVILPQSQGTGLSEENATIDAAINGVLNRYVGGEYVASEYSTGLAFQNHDGTNDTVEVGPGIIFVQDNSTSTSGKRGSGGNPQAESSTTSGYDTELPEGHTYAVLLPTATQISVSDSTLNEVYVDIDDVTANNSVNLEHDGSTTASPGGTSLKIGETNPDDASADTRANDDASPTYDSLTVNGTTDTDALNAGQATIDGVQSDLHFTEDTNSPLAINSSKNANPTGLDDYDVYKVYAKVTNTNATDISLTLNGFTGQNYSYSQSNGSTNAGETSFSPVVRHGQNSAETYFVFMLSPGGIKTDDEDYAYSAQHAGYEPNDSVIYGSVDSTGSSTLDQFELSTETGNDADWRLNIYGKTI